MSEQERTLSEELAYRMRRARLKMRGLGKLAEQAAERRGMESIHWSSVQGIINAPRRVGHEIQPRANTLRVIALGLATDPEDPTIIDEKAADEHYRALARAAGFSSVSGPESVDRELEKMVETFVPEQSIAATFADGITAWKQFDIADQNFIVSAIRTARKRAGLPDLRGQLPEVAELEKDV